MKKKVLLSLLTILVIINLWDTGRSTPQSPSSSSTPSINTTPWPTMQPSPERTHLNWDEFIVGLKVSPKAKIPHNYKFSIALKQMLMFSTNASFPDGKMTETEMNDFLMEHYLPSDCYVTKKENYFDERRRSNGTDYEVTKYTLLSPYLDDEFIIEYRYPYDRNHELALTFQDVTVEK